MKKLLGFIALGLSIQTFAQKNDSVAFCEVRVFRNSAMGPDYIFNIISSAPDGKAVISNNSQCAFEIGAIGKLGAQGWTLISTRQEGGEIPNLVYTLQKIYKRK